MPRGFRPLILQHMQLYLPHFKITVASMVKFGYIETDFEARAFTFNVGNCLLKKKRISYS